MRKWIAMAAACLCLLLTTAYAEGPKISFSHESGFYSNPFSLEISCNDRKAKIYYTLDGSMPTQDSELYSEGLYMMYSSICQPKLMLIEGIQEGEPHVVEDDYPMAHVIRAMAVNSRGECSEVISATYFVGYDRAKLYGDTPVMLLVTDPANLFDYETGIYVLGKCYDDWRAEQTESYDEWDVVGNFTQKGHDWERPVSVTFLPGEGEGFSQEMGMRIKGKASRIFGQKSIRLIAREAYGQKNVKYAIYPDNVREEDGGIVSKYKSFTLRSGGSDCNCAKIRDPFISNLATGLKFETAQNMPCITFINGEFWGIYTLNEEYTDNYIQYHYGIDNKNVITVKVGQIEDGEEEDIRIFKVMADAILEHDMADAEAYEAASQLLDMNSFADYCALQFYIYNEDGCFKNNNWQMWNVRDPQLSDETMADGKWRMMLFDTDYSTGIYSKGKNALEDNITPVITKTSYQGRTPGNMLTSLLKSPVFTQKLIKAFCDVRNLYFDVDRVDAQVQEMTDDYFPYAADTLKRFGPDWTLYDPEDYLSGQIGYMHHFFTTRYESFLPIVQNAFGLNDPCAVKVQISGAEKGQVHFNGRTLPVESGAEYLYFPEYSLDITAVPAEGATFKGWTVSHDSAVVADPEALSTEVSFTHAFTLTANFE